MGKCQVHPVTFSRDIVDNIKRYSRSCIFTVGDTKINVSENILDILAVYRPCNFIAHIEDDCYIPVFDTLKDILWNDGASVHIHIYGFSVLCCFNPAPDNIPAVFPTISLNKWFSRLRLAAICILVCHIRARIFIIRAARIIVRGSRIIRTSLIIVRGSRIVIILQLFYRLRIAMSAIRADIGHNALCCRGRLLRHLRGIAVS